MNRKEYRRNSETIASLLLSLKMHCNENTNKCIDETLRAWSKLKQIEQIVNDWNNDASHSFSDMCKINEIIKRE